MCLSLRNPWCRPSDVSRVRRCAVSGVRRLALLHLGGALSAVRAPFHTFLLIPTMDSHTLVWTLELG